MNTFWGPIFYRNGYKNQLSEEAEGPVPFNVGKAEIETEFISVTPAGLMTVKAGYAWDGASGPTIDTDNTLTPSLVHDCACQLIRNAYLPASARAIADRFFYDQLRERKMWWPRARVWYAGVRIGARYNTQKPKKTLTAP